jgi:hypothetical protein
MALTDALRNGSHPITVHLMTCFGHRDALTARWHADVAVSFPVGVGVLSRSTSFRRRDKAERPRTPDRARSTVAARPG